MVAELVVAAAGFAPALQKMVARQFPSLLREEEGGARCRFMVVARRWKKMALSW